MLWEQRGKDEALCPYQWKGIRKSKDIWKGRSYYPRRLEHSEYDSSVRQGWMAQGVEGLGPNQLAARPPDGAGWGDSQTLCFCPGWSRGWGWECTGPASGLWLHTADGTYSPGTSENPWLMALWSLNGRHEHLPGLSAWVWWRPSTSSVGGEINLPNHWGLTSGHRCPPHIHSPPPLQYMQRRAGFLNTHTIIWGQLVLFWRTGK